MKELLNECYQRQEVSLVLGLKDCTVQLKQCAVDIYLPLVPLWAHNEA
jgi:hypothetical protein